MKENDGSRDLSKKAFLRKSLFFRKKAFFDGSRDLSKKAFLRKKRLFGWLKNYQRKSSKNKR